MTLKEITSCSTSILTSVKQIVFVLNISWLFGEGLRSTKNKGALLIVFLG